MSISPFSPPSPPPSLPSSSSSRWRRNAVRWDAFVSSKGGESNDHPSHVTCPSPNPPHNYPSFPASICFLEMTSSSKSFLFPLHHHRIHRRGCSANTKPDAAGWCQADGSIEVTSDTDVPPGAALKSYYDVSARGSRLGRTMSFMTAVWCEMLRAYTVRRRKRRRRKRGKKKKIHSISTTVVIIAVTTNSTSTPPPPLLPFAVGEVVFVFFFFFFFVALCR